MRAPLTFSDVQSRYQATAAPPQPAYAQRALVDSAALRAALQAQGVIRKPRAREFEATIKLDDPGVRDAALAILAHEVRGSEVRLARIVAQSDPRVAAALLRLAARRGLPLEAA
jgi:hypothetical protein